MARTGNLTRIPVLGVYGGKPRFGGDLSELAANVQAIVDATQATESALPASGNWKGRQIRVTDETDRAKNGVRAWNGTAWPAAVGAFTPTGIYGKDGLRAVRSNGRIYMEGALTSSSAKFDAGTQYPVGAIPASFAPASDTSWAVIANVTAPAIVIVSTDGSMSIIVSQTFTGGLSVSLVGGSWSA